MLPAGYLIFAVGIRLLSGIAYAWAVIKRRAKPNPITWFFWALTPMIVFAAQLFEHVSPGTLAVTFILGFSPLVVFLLSLRHNLQRSHFTPSTITCGILAALGVVLWLTTNDPILAIIFSIAADIFGSIPTVVKAYRTPKSEVPLPYLLSMASMVVTVLTITHWSFADYAFPVYIFGINLVIFCLVYYRPGVAVKRRIRSVR